MSHKKSQNTKARAVMAFANMIRGAYSANFIDNHPTVYDIYRSAQNYVKDHFDFDTENWDDELAKQSRVDDDFISVHDHLPPANEYVVLKHEDPKAPPAIGWATYWHPSNEFGGFVLTCDGYVDDFGNNFTHWMPLPKEKK